MYWLISIETKDGITFSQLDQASDALKRVFEYMLLENVLRITIRRSKGYDDA